MFIELLKIKSKANELDKKGLIKTANKADNRISRLSNFISNIHKVKLSGYLKEKLLIAKNIYDNYLITKTAGMGDDDLDSFLTGTPSATSIPKQENDPSTFNLMDLPDSEEAPAATAPVEAPVRTPRTKTKKIEETGISGLSGHLAGAFEKSVFDVNVYPEFFMGMEGTPSENLFEKGYLENNGSKLIIDENNRLIASDISDIIRLRRGAEEDEERSSDFNERRFVGMPPRLFCQLMQRALGRDVQHPAISELSAEEAKEEYMNRVSVIAGVSVSKKASEDVGQGEVIDILRKYLNKSGKIHGEGRERDKFLRDPDRFDNFINNKDYVGLIEDIGKYATASATRMSQNSKRNTYSLLTLKERMAFGNEFFYGRFKKKLEEMAQKFGFQINKSATPEQLDKLREEVVRTWDLTNFEKSPLFSPEDENKYREIYRVDRAFGMKNSEIEILKKVIYDEKSKYSVGGEANKFLATANPEKVVSFYQNLGMIWKIMTYAVSKEQVEEEKRLQREGGESKEKLIDSLFKSYPVPELRVEAKSGEIDLFPAKNTKQIIKSEKLEKVILKIADIVDDQTSEEKQEIQEWNLSGALNVLKTQANNNAYSLVYKFITARGRTESFGDLGKGEDGENASETMVQERMKPVIPQQNILTDDSKEDDVSIFEKISETDPIWDAITKKLFQRIIDTKKTNVKLISTLGLDALFSENMSQVDAQKTFLAKMKPVVIRYFKTIRAQSDTEDLMDLDFKAKMEEEYDQKVLSYQIDEEVEEKEEVGADGTTKIVPVKKKVVRVVFENGQVVTLEDQTIKSKEEVLQELRDKREKEIDGKGKIDFEFLKIVKGIEPEATSYLLEQSGEKTIVYAVFFQGIGENKRDITDEIENMMMRNPEVIFPKDSSEVAREDDKASGEDAIFSGGKTWKRTLRHDEAARVTKWINSVSADDLEVQDFSVQDSILTPEEIIENESVDQEMKKSDAQDPEVQYIRSILLNDNIMNILKTTFSENETTEPENETDYPPLPSKFQSPKSFNISWNNIQLGRYYSFLYYVCGIEKAALPTVVVDGNIERKIKMYLRALRYANRHLKDKIPEIALDKIFIDRDFSPKISKTGEQIVPGNSMKSGKSKIEVDEKIERRLLFVSNDEGMWDVDSAIMLANNSLSNFHPYMSEVRKVDKIPERSKALYLMQLKNFMNCLRLNILPSAVMSILKTNSRIQVPDIREGKQLLDAKGKPKYKAETGSTDRFFGDNKDLVDDFIERLKKLRENFEANYKKIIGEELLQEEEKEKKIQNLRTEYLDIKLKEIDDAFNKETEVQFEDEDKESGSNEKGKLFKFIERQKLIDVTNSTLLKKSKAVGSQVPGFVPLDRNGGTNAVELFEKYKEYLRNRYTEEYINRIGSSHPYLKETFKEIIKMAVPLPTNSVEQIDKAPKALYDIPLVKIDDGRYAQEYLKTKNIISESIIKGIEPSGAIVAPDVDESVEVPQVAPAGSEQVSPQSGLPSNVQQPPVGAKAPISPIKQQVEMLTPQDRQSEIEKWKTNMVAKGGMVRQNSDEYRRMLELGFTFEPTGFGNLLEAISPVNQTAMAQSKQAIVVAFSKKVDELEELSIFSDDEIDYILSKYGF